MDIDALKRAASAQPPRERPTVRWSAIGAYAATGLLIVWSSWIHLHLWQSLGYRQIATIGPLFLVQAIGGFLLGVVVLVARRVWAAALGAGFAILTMAGFVVSAEHGLFGFKDSWSAPFAHEAFALELAILGASLVAGSLSLLGTESVTSWRHRAMATASIGAALVLAGVVVSLTSASGTMAPPSAAGDSAMSMGPMGGAHRTSSDHITISNFMFDSMSLTVEPGATISVTNDDSATHTLTATGGQFNTGDIEQHQTKTIRAPMKPGSYRYICDIHQFMTGTIIVK